ncbi:hypothetical protein T310_9168 [Rasamsonia emersonii CBS 393.64]|uniref:Uncharacterized protein n=1 Tax=Rasamsonia emersonii (strain ATCC 16479 / CBS 393.64 / IMI 116815) TaxID=1408163 RepID=A0A0F4YHU0_RASE3|nr:hypothetical protein T310_9168 [Rasamsonia emersonii CBS 393.64]KKA17178.1 hypothetical protein T310_9168 [Rasamsonia emersonii CBS 393.64]
MRDTHRRHLSLQLRVRLRPHTQLEERILLARRLRILVVQPAEILARHGVDDLRPDLPSDLAVLVEDRVVGEAEMDTDQRVVQAADVCDAAGEAEAATAYTYISALALSVSQ